MQLPETSNQVNDLTDIVIESAKSLKEIEVDGKMVLQETVDHETIWWKTLIVAKPTLGRFAKELKDFENLAVEAFYSMSAPRAKILSRQILGEGKSYRHSLDSLSSVSRMDRNNTQQTLVDKINSNKIERYYSLKEDAKQSLLSGIFGGKKKDDHDV